MAPFIGGVSGEARDTVTRYHPVARYSFTLTALGRPLPAVGRDRVRSCIRAAGQFVHDQVGSTVLLLGTAGNVAGGYAYTPYGLAAHSGTGTTALQYTGQYTDSESGLVYLRARYYDPATAQFLCRSADRYHPHSVHLRR